MASKPEPPLIGAVKKAVGGRHKQPGRLAFVSWATIRRIYDIVHIMVLRGVAAVLAATVSLIPNPIDQNRWAHWRNPMDMMRQG
jgi:hypothetical protein